MESTVLSSSVTEVSREQIRTSASVLSGIAKKTDHRSLVSNHTSQGTSKVFSILSNLFSMSESSVSLTFSSQAKPGPTLKEIIIDDVTAAVAIAVTGSIAGDAPCEACAALAGPNGLIATGSPDNR
jgi:hypothetical protein